MRRTIGVVVLLTLVFFQREAALAQAEIQPERLPLDLPLFYVDALSFASDQPQKSRLDIFLEVPYEQLHFTNVGQVFSATYEVTMSLYDTDDKLVDEKWMKNSVETKDYNESVSAKQSGLSQRSFLLPPNEYSLVVQITDTDTRKTFRRKRDIVVKDFSSHGFSVSDVLLVKRLETEGNNKVVYPNISGNVGDLGQGFYVFFEIYNHIAADSAIIHAGITNVRGEKVGGDTCGQALDSTRIACFCKLTTSQLAAGNYSLSIDAIPYYSATKAAATDSTVSASRPFEIRWRGMPASVVDLDIALDEMQYVMEKEDINKIKLLDNNAKRERFFEFWKRKDPTPGTERNELMEEYFARVEYANKHFTHYYEGWKTDMGMVYIIFGPPSNIERHPFDMDARPYEIWTYYDKNREFVFVDISGFGDYRLQTPIWDIYQTRPR